MLFNEFVDFLRFGFDEIARSLPPSIPSLFFCAPSHLDIYKTLVDPLAGDAKLISLLDEQTTYT